MFGGYCCPFAQCCFQVQEKEEIRDLNEVRLVCSSVPSYKSRAVLNAASIRDLSRRRFDPEQSVNILALSAQ